MFILSKRAFRDSSLWNFTCRAQVCWTIHQNRHFLQSWAAFQNQYNLSIKQTSRSLIPPFRAASRLKIYSRLRSELLHLPIWAFRSQAVQRNFQLQLRIIFKVWVLHRRWKTTRKTILLRRTAALLPQQCRLLQLQLIKVSSEQFWAFLTHSHVINSIP